MGLKDILKKKATNQDLPEADSKDIVQEISNWYSDRYGVMLIQRNFLFLIAAASILITIIALFLLGSLAVKKTVQPFVIEVEDRTGVTSIVNPINDKVLTGNQSLNQYFIMKYIMARESYNRLTYRYNYLTVARLLSNDNVYSNFRHFINYSPKSPLVLYGKFQSTKVMMSSILFEGKDPDTKDQKVVIRFTIYAGNYKKILIHRVATLNYRYVQMQLSQQEREINPLGFQITKYVAADENVN